MQISTFSDEISHVGCNRLVAQWHFFNIFNKQTTFFIQHWRNLCRICWNDSRANIYQLNWISSIGKARKINNLRLFDLWPIKDSTIWLFSGNAGQDSLTKLPAELIIFFLQVIAIFWPLGSRRHAGSGSCGNSDGFFRVRGNVAPREFLHVAHRRCCNY